MKRKVIDRNPETGEELLMIWGDPLKWEYGTTLMPDGTREFWRAVSKDGLAGYIVGRNKAIKIDAKGHPIYAYWKVVYEIKGEPGASKPIGLAVDFMSAFEAKEVCQIIDSERSKTLEHKKTLTHKRKLLSSSSGPSPSGGLNLDEQSKSEPTIDSSESPRED